MHKPYPQTDDIVERHPLSAAWGNLEPDDFKFLGADIRENGLLNPIMLYEEMVLDGWQRLDGCAWANVDPRFVHFEELHPNSSPIKFVIAQNARRRHLSKSQLALAIVKTSDWKDKGRPSEDAPGATEKDMAHDVGVSDRTIRQAKKVVGTEHEEPVAKGKMSVRDASRAVSAAAETPEKQPETVADLNTVPDWSLKEFKRHYSRALDQLGNLGQRHRVHLGRINALENELALYKEKESGVSDDLLRTFARLQGETDTAESSRRHWQRKYNEAERENRRLRKLLRDKGVKIKK